MDIKIRTNAPVRIIYDVGLVPPGVLLRTEDDIQICAEDGTQIETETTSN